MRSYRRTLGSCGAAVAARLAARPFPIDQDNTCFAPVRTQRLTRR